MATTGLAEVFPITAGLNNFHEVRRIAPNELEGLVLRTIEPDITRLGGCQYYRHARGMNGCNEFVGPRDQKCENIDSDRFGFLLDWTAKGTPDASKGGEWSWLVAL